MTDRTRRPSAVRRSTLETLQDDGAKLGQRHPDESAEVEDTRHGCPRRDQLPLIPIAIKSTPCPIMEVAKPALRQHRRFRWTSAGPTDTTVGAMEGDPQ